MTENVTKNSRRASRGEAALSRDTIIDAAIALLDSSGENGLTFRALATKLATGAGAIYWHVADKDALFTAASDVIMARAIGISLPAATPRQNIQTLALAVFEAMDQHPWLGSALSQAPGRLPTVRLLERLGRQVAALGVPAGQQWVAACTLLNYLLGVGGQNAANASIARVQDLERTHFLETLSAAWSQLDAQEYPFTRSVAAKLREHDDRADFLAGIDLIVQGMLHNTGTR